MHKILLTGSSGFIGYNVLSNFSENNQVYIIVRKKPSKKLLRNKNIKVIQFKNYETLHSKIKKIKVDTVIHCATYYIRNHKFTDIQKLCNSNIFLGNIILENLENIKASKFINFSTVWEDSNAKANNPENLYAAYKKSFSIILNFYKKKLREVDFYELMISDTFGKNDFRNKIVNTLKKNYLKGRKTSILSKNLHMNLLNVKDIIEAIKLILNKKVIPKKYLLKNSSDTKIMKLVKIFNKNNKKQLKIKWESNTIIKNKIYQYDKLKGWKPNNSDIGDIIKFIKD